MRKRAYLALALGLTLSALASCGDEGIDLYIIPWSMPWESIVANTEGPLEVTLNAPVEAKEYIDITNNYRDYVMVTPEFLTLKAGERKGKVIIKGITATGGAIKLTFTVRSTQRSRDFQFTVNAPAY